ncbi:leucine-rich repeat transmembrane protein FLRT3-like [Topomyia yanbarensis]|uniref:leucine-rich repeat transmembrane protein FLRT3-like n=1 Tax=Topomyia yanbarensis TaxID=2498891 RepID=UPI00273C4A47|nr:leucine-rich repeat transmembrane protein FLRT3-like [Topomyia yanbarensis]
MLFQLLLLSFSFFRPSQTEAILAPPPLSCKNSRSTICTLQDVIFVDYRVPKLPNLAGKHTLQIRSGNITRFSNDLSAALGDITKLLLGHLEIKSLWIKSNIIHLSAEGNLIQHVIVDSSEEPKLYKLKHLNLMNNRLNTLQDLKHLTLLEELRLDGNQLEFVEMSTFALMNNLRKLSLSRNKISKISTSDKLQLPALDSLSFGSNNLTTLSVTNWEMSQLTELVLSNNQLVSVDVENFTQFVSLEKLALAGNSWNCFWLRSALEKIDQKFITLVDKDGECPDAMPIEDICCSISDVSVDQPSFADLVVRIQLLEEAHEQMDKNLTKRLELVAGNWNTELREVERVVDEKKERWSQLSDSNEDDMVTEDDKVELEEMLAKVHGTMNELRELGKKHAKFAHEFANLFYRVMEQKNKLTADMKTIQNLKDEMERYQISFDGN